MLVPLLFFVVFETIAITLWLTLGNIFYLFNFSYIGICLSVDVHVFYKPFRIVSSGAYRL